MENSCAQTCLEFAVLMKTFDTSVAAIRANAMTTVPDKLEQLKELRRIIAKTINMVRLAAVSDATDV